MVGPGGGPLNQSPFGHPWVVPSCSPTPLVSDLASGLVQPQGGPRLLVLPPAPGVAAVGGHFACCMNLNLLGRHKEKEIRPSLLGRPLSNTPPPSTIPFNNLFAYRHGHSGPCSASRSRTAPRRVGAAGPGSPCRTALWVCFVFICIFMVGWARFIFLIQNHPILPSHLSQIRPGAF